MARIKETIWLLVSDDAKIPIETKTEPNRIKPRYDVRLAPKSIIPMGLPK